MKLATETGRIAALVAGVVISLPQLALADPGVAIKDVALQAKGTLKGHVVDSRGRPVPSRVALLQQGKTVAQSRTESTGAFSVHGLKGGVYEIRTDHGTGFYRLWSAKSAPPIASQSVLLVNNKKLVRGQLVQAAGLFPAAGGMLSTTAIIGAVTVSAVTQTAGSRAATDSIALRQLARI